MGFRVWKERGKSRRLQVPGSRFQVSGFRQDGNHSIFSLRLLSMYCVSLRCYQHNSQPQTQIKIQKKPIPTTFSLRLLEVLTSALCAPRCAAAPPWQCVPPPGQQHHHLQPGKGAGLPQAVRTPQGTAGGDGWRALVVCHPCMHTFSMFTFPGMDPGVLNLWIQCGTHEESEIVLSTHGNIAHKNGKTYHT